MVNCGEDLRSGDPARELNNPISELQAPAAYPQHWSSGEHEQHIKGVSAPPSVIERKPWT